MNPKQQCLLHKSIIFSENGIQIHQILLITEAVMHYYSCIFEIKHLAFYIYIQEKYETL